MVFEAILSFKSVSSLSVWACEGLKSESGKETDYKSEILINSKAEGSRESG